MGQMAFDRIVAAYADNDIVVDDSIFTGNPVSQCRCSENHHLRVDIRKIRADVSYSMKVKGSPGENGTLPRRT